jgi:hypothetical protein
MPGMPVHVYPPKLPGPQEPSGVIPPPDMDVAELALEEEAALGGELTLDVDDIPALEEEKTPQLPKALWHPAPQYRISLPQNPEEEQHGCVPRWLPVQVYPFAPPQVPSGVTPPLADGDGDSDETAVETEGKTLEDPGLLSSYTPPSTLGGVLDAPALAAATLYKSSVLGRAGLITMTMPD